MKAKVSLHNHTTFSDGTATVSEMVEGAYKKGFTHFAISDHVPNPSYRILGIPTERYNEYIDEIEQQKEKFKGKMNVYASLESDYYNNVPFSHEGDTKLLEISKRLDYITGSMHFLTKNGAYCLSEFKEENLATVRDLLYGGDERKMVEDYYRTYVKMLDFYNPPICAHVDIIKLNNKHLSIFDEKSQWYKDCVRNVLEEIKKRDVVLELNFGPISRYGGDFTYPGTMGIKMAKEIGVKMTLSADAHSVDGIDENYLEARAMLIDAGYDKIYVPGKESWEAMDF